MPKLIIIDHTGAEREIEAETGLSIMENVRAGGFDEVLAICGGCCSCATCHVVVDAEWFAATGVPSEDENELLDSSEHRTATSRLSCQIRMTDAFDGMKLTLPPSE